MRYFSPATASASARHAEIWAAYEIAHTAVDFAAAALFVVGSILFFWPSTTYAATWFFVVGSVCFAMKPTIRLLREVRLVRLGHVDAVAERLDE